MKHSQTETNSAPVTQEQHEWLNKVMTNESLNQKEPPNSDTVSCLFIPEQPFPWNGAYIEWSRELSNEPK